MQRKLTAILSADVAGYSGLMERDAAARFSYAVRRLPDAIRYFEKAAGMMESDFGSVGMLQSCYEAVGDHQGTRSAALRTLERVEKVVVSEPDNGSAMGFAVGAHARLGKHRTGERLGQARLAARSR